MRRVGIGAIFLGLLPARSPGLVRGPHRAVTTYTRSVEPHRQLIQKHWASSSRHYGLLASDKEIEKRTYRWIVEIVYGLGLCPWSGNVICKRGKSKESVPRLLIKNKPGVNLTKKGLLEFEESFVADCEDLQAKTNGTTLLVVSSLTDFAEFLKLAEYAEEILKTTGLEKEIQLATFHPDYLFEGEDAVTSYTNRSPYPTLHLLRVEDVATAINSYEREGKSTDDVWKRNKELFIERGEKKSESHLNDIIHDSYH